ncbi:exopolysaccharide biosynthesis protein [Ideonella margarita]|uniref:Exopolysaccharide biosynthesis protein n=1 Tax=Ideonella margarita TaxID=2984191 RepID=A0ABU9C7P5_9BURK
MTIPLAQRLREAAAALDTDRVSVARLVQAHGAQAHGSLLLLLALACMLPLPGAGTVFGLGILTMTWPMWCGQAEARLPQRVSDVDMSRDNAHRVLSTLARLYGMAHHVSKERLTWALGNGEHGAARRGIAATVAVMAVVVVLPIPLGNFLPSISIGLIGVGLVFRDGVSVMLGQLTAVATAALMLTLGVLAVEWGGDWVNQLLRQWPV